MSVNRPPHPVRLSSPKSGSTELTEVRFSSLRIPNSAFPCIPHSGTRFQSSDDILSMPLALPKSAASGNPRRATSRSNTKCHVNASVAWIIALSLWAEKTLDRSHPGLTRREIDFPNLTARRNKLWFQRHRNAPQPSGPRAANVARMPS